MEGYVYVMSNKAMPGLVKVGFTTGTPEERASQLNGTHSPHPVVVEYFILVPDARSTERKAHRRLRAQCERKEWFRCTREVAIAAIKRSVGDVTKREFSRVEQEKERAAEQERLRLSMQEERRAKAEEERKARLRGEVKAKYFPILEQTGSAPGYLAFWAGASVVACVGLAVSSHLSDLGILLGGVLLAGIPAVVLKEWADNRKKDTEPYRQAVARRQAELDAIDRSVLPAIPEKVVIPCPTCHGRMRVPAGKTLELTCPHCRNVFRLST